jgi:microcystin-dependent protein
LLCKGQSVLRTDYPSLFTVIGTAYGAVDGAHFSVPDLRGRVPAGVDDGAGRLTPSYFGSTASLSAVGGSEYNVLTPAQLAVHTHANTLTDGGHFHSGALNTGAAYNSPGGATSVAGNVTTNTGISTSGVSINNASAGGGDGHNNVQPTIVLNYIIKAH